METSPKPGLRERVRQAAERALKQNGSVGPLELFNHVGFLQWAHVEAWRKGNEYYPNLEQHIQVGPEKFEKSLRYFQEWVAERGLRPVEASYTRRSPSGIQELQVTIDADPEREKFYRTHYAPGDLPPKKASRIAQKLKQAPELVVFIKVSDEGNCSECKAELDRGDFLLMEKGEPLCMRCADMDHMLFLPSGDAALTRRSRNYSPLSAVVVKFSRARKRYERQGLLVAEEALRRAEEECLADAPERAAARARSAVVRSKEDEEFIDELTQAITKQYPGCPPEEARQIAEHAGRRSSGRVGRSAAGRELDPKAVQLAVIAHVRHAHTKYDTLLMEGAERLDARAIVREDIDRVLARWKQ